MSWKRACSVDELDANALREVEVDDIPIVIVSLGDEFRAIPPNCPHMEEPLAQSGMCADGVLTCTKHLWQWDVRTGEERGDAEKPLLMYETKVEDGDLYVYVDKELEYEYEEEEDDEDDD